LWNEVVDGTRPDYEFCRTTTKYHCDEGIKLYGNKGIVGRSVVVYENEDDGFSTYAESLGEPIACGTILEQKLSDNEAPLQGCTPAGCEDIRVSGCDV